MKSTLRHTVWTVYLDKRRPVRRPAVHRACLFPAVDHSSRSCCRRDWDVYHWYFATRGDPGKDLSSMWKVVATERIQIGQCCAKSKSSSCLLTGTCSVQWLSAASEQLFFSAHARFGEGVLIYDSDGLTRFPCCPACTRNLCTSNSLLLMVMASQITMLTVVHCLLRCPMIARSG